MDELCATHCEEKPKAQYDSVTDIHTLNTEYNARVSVMVTRCYDHDCQMKLEANFTTVTGQLEAAGLKPEQVTTI